MGTISSCTGKEPDCNAATLGSLRAGLAARVLPGKWGGARYTGTNTPVHMLPFLDSDPTDPTYLGVGVTLKTVHGQHALWVNLPPNAVSSIISAIMIFEPGFEPTVLHGAVVSTNISNAKIVRDGAVMFHMEPGSVPGSAPRVGLVFVPGDSVELSAVFEVSSETPEAGRSSSTTIWCDVGVLTDTITALLALPWQCLWTGIRKANPEALNVLCVRTATDAATPVSAQAADAYRVRLAFRFSVLLAMLQEGGATPSAALAKVIDLLNIGSVAHALVAEDVCGDTLLTMPWRPEEGATMTSLLLRFLGVETLPESLGAFTRPMPSAACPGRCVDAFGCTGADYGYEDDASLAQLEPGSVQGIDNVVPAMASMVGPTGLTPCQHLLVRLASIPSIMSTMDEPAAKLIMEDPDAWLKQKEGLVVLCSLWATLVTLDMGGALNAAVPAEYKQFYKTSPATLVAGPVAVFHGPLSAFLLAACPGVKYSAAVRAWATSSLGKESIQDEIVLEIANAETAHGESVRAGAGGASAAAAATVTAAASTTVTITPECVTEVQHAKRRDRFVVEFLNRTFASRKGPASVQLAYLLWTKVREMFSVWEDMVMNELSSQDDEDDDYKYV